MTGIFDSGVGGLTVWKELEALMPGEDYIYVSDGANCPYGNKPPQEIVNRAVAIVSWLEDRGADLIVVACNTATAAAIEHLRSRFDLPFVGMEPALKPAALHSQSGVVGVLATAGTLKGALYHRTLARFASEVRVVERVGEGLVELVERGVLAGPEVEAVLTPYINDMIAQGADHIVLGCTHYPFLAPEISRIAGPSVKIVNPAPAVARQAERLLTAGRGVQQRRTTPSEFVSTGATDTLERLVTLIKGSEFESVFHIINI